MPRIPYIASPNCSSHRVTLPHPQPDDSWAVDERSLQLFVNQLQEPPADGAWYELRREAERVALVPGFDRLMTLEARDQGDPLPLAPPLVPGEIGRAHV